MEKLNKVILPFGLVGFVLLCALLTFFNPIGGDFWPVVFEFLGSFHPMILHLPIGLWFGVICLMLASVKCPIVIEKPWVYWFSMMVFFSGAAAFILGFFLYFAGSYAVETVSLHMYGALGFLVAVAIFTQLLRFKMNLVVLWVGALIVSGVLGYAGHIGGVMTHGDPLEKAPWVVFKNRATQEENKSAEVFSAEDAKVFQNIILPMLDEKCFSCHGSERAKGKLRMNSYEALLVGGSKGPSLVPGDVKESLMLERIHLPREHKEHMPPKEKLQVSKDELAFLEWWVKEGASPSARVIDSAIPEEHKSLVMSFVGDDPAAIRRRQQKVLKDKLMIQYKDIALKYPGILTQAIEGEVAFELNSASIFQIDEAELRKLVRPLATHIRRIDWNLREVTQEWMEILLISESLEVLNLNQAKISTEQVRLLLEKHQNLQKINLSGTQVKDEIVEPLLPRLASGKIKQLILSDTQLSKEAIERINKAIPQVNVLLP